jgi:hypothetical protein
VGQDVPNILRHWWKIWSKVNMDEDLVDYSKEEEEAF